MSADPAGEGFPEGLPSPSNDLVEDVPPEPLKSPGSQGQPIPPVINAEGRGKILDDLRYRLARYTLLFVATEGVGSMLLLLVLPPDRLDVLRELLPLIFAPIVALVSTCFAWFFASESRTDGNLPPRP